MADYPCDMHLGTYPGVSTRLYLNLYRDDQTAALRASVCPDCCDELVAAWLERGRHKSPDGYWDAPAPGQDLEGLWQARRGPSDVRSDPRRPGGH